MVHLEHCEPSLMSKNSYFLRTASQNLGLPLVRAQHAKMRKLAPSVIILAQPQGNVFCDVICFRWSILAGWVVGSRRDWVVGSRRGAVGTGWPCLRDWAALHSTRHLGLGLQCPMLMWDWVALGTKSQSYCGDWD